MAEEQKPYNAGDAQDVQKRAKGKKLRELQKEAALRQFLANPAGRMWMWDLLGLCGTFHSSFSREALVMAFQEGRRDIGNQIIGEMNRIGPEYYMKMAVENQGEKEKD